MKCAGCGKEGGILVDEVDASGSVYTPENDVIGTFSLSISLTGGNKLCYDCIGKQLSSMHQGHPFTNLTTKDEKQA